MKKIGFIGGGIMGKSMIRNLLKAGFEVQVYTRTKSKAGTLTILVGGDREDYEACIPVFKAMGKKLCYEGASGNGQHVKMCNQIAIAGTLAGACEAIAYACKVGVDPKTMLGDISEGAAGSFQMSNVASRALNGDYAPGFFLKHFIKDLSIAQSESADRETTLPVLDEVLELCNGLEKEGNGDCGTQVLVKHYLG